MTKTTLIVAAVMGFAGFACQAPVESSGAPAVATASADAIVEPAPAPSAEPTPSATPSPSPSPSPEPSPTPSASPSPEPSPSPTPYTFSGGNGTQANPYQLETALDVQNIGQAPNAYFTVVQDINMNGMNFQPISSFGGTIYGNNKQLYNLAISTSGSANASMFGTITNTATIVQLVLQNAVISSEAGYATGFAVTLKGFISNCRVVGTITSPLGGNGFNTGTGNSVRVVRQAPGQIVNTTQSVMFNGNFVNATLNE